MKERDPDFDAVTQTEIFNEAKDRLQICIDAESANRKQAKYDLEFNEGLNHWDSQYITSESMDSPELTINLTDALTRRVVNNMKQQRPRGKAHPVGEGATIETSEVINGIGRHVEYRSEASVAYDKGGTLAVICGWGYWRMISEYVAPNSFDQDIRILPIMNIFSVYLDPSAIMPTACDMGWGLISIKMKRTEFKRKHPRAENASWSDEMGEGDDWEDKESIRLAEYFRIIEKPEKLYSLRTSKGEEFTRFKSEMPSDESLVAAGIEVVDERDSGRREVQWFLLNGRKVVDRKIIPGTWIPIIRCEGNAADVDGKIMRRGMVRAMVDPQRMVDYGEVAKIKRLGLTPQSPWVAAEGQLDGHPEWTDANTKATAVLTYKPVTIQTAQGEIPLPPPQRQPPAQLEAGFAEFTAGMRSNLLAVAGMPNEPGQDEQGQVVSGRAIDRRQHLSDQSHFQYYDNQTLAIAHTWRIMLEWIPHYMSEERMQRIIGEDGQPRMVKINEKSTDPGVTAVKNDIDVGRYDVVMDTGPGYDTKRQEGSDSLIQLMGIPELAKIVSSVGADLVFRSIDHPYMQELADRISAMTPDGLKEVMEGLPDRAKAIVQALSNENSQLKKALEQAQTDAKYGITKAHIAATVKAHDVEESNKTRRQDTQTKADTARFDTVVDSHTKIAVADIAASASLLNTHAEAKHHKEEAERMIKAGEKAEGNA
jgi:hypothetical protein